MLLQAQGYVLVPVVFAMRGGEGVEMVAASPASCGDIVLLLRGNPSSAERSLVLWLGEAISRGSVKVWWVILVCI
jgi:hypothetical protein